MSKDTSMLCEMVSDVMEERGLLDVRVSGGVVTGVSSSNDSSVLPNNCIEDIDIGKVVCIIECVRMYRARIVPVESLPKKSIYRMLLDEDIEENLSLRDAVLSVIK